MNIRVLVKLVDLVKIILSSLLMLMLPCLSMGQVTVFNDDFSTNTNTSWTTSGTIGASAWSVLRSGNDWGARRNVAPEQLELTNDASPSTNLAGWIFAMTSTTSFNSPYDTVLQEGGKVTWAFNMRQSRTNPGGFDSGDFGIAFILAGETVTGATNGNGYAVVLGESGSNDPIRLVAYTDGIMGNSTLTNLITSNTTGLSDFGNEYLSIKVTYNPCLNDQWELFVRNDGNVFQDPLSGELILQGTAINNQFTNFSLQMMAAYWQGAIAANQTAFFDNISVQVDTVVEVEAGSYGPVCTNDPDITLTGNPTGGQWSGIGVTGNTFNPNAGTQTLTYEVTDQNGCFASDQTTVTVNPCITAPEMRWILLEETEQNGTCISISDCDDDVICYALQYTPNMTGTLTSYTTAFFVDCIEGQDPIISNASCTMSDASSTTNGCDDFDLVLINASGNTGNVAVTKDVPKILHQVCFAIPSGVIEIVEDSTTDLTTSIDSTMGGGPESEFPSYVTSTLDSTLDCSILPLRFLNFTAIPVAYLQSQLDWVTVDEMNNSHFDIQRSNDAGKSFNKIGEVKGYANPRAINHYKYLDKHAKQGFNYYRLKQIDLDDQFQYSPVRSVYFGEGEFSITIWPNPVSDILFIRINQMEISGTLQVIDNLGKEVITRELQAGESNINLPVHHLHPGTYNVSLHIGAVTHEERIVVARN